MTLTRGTTSCLAALVLVIGCSGRASASVSGGSEVEACNRVVDEADEAAKQGDFAEAQSIHKAVVRHGELTNECRQNLTVRLGESCERLEGTDLYMCAELLDEAASAASFAADDRWRVEADVLFRVADGREKDGNLPAAESAYESLHRVVARSPEPVREGLLRDLLLEEGDYYLETNRPERAEGIFSELVTMSRRSDEQDISDVVFPLGRLAAAYESQGQLDEARDYLEQAIGLVEDKMGEDSPALVVLLEQYARVMTKLGEDEPAATAAGRAAQLR